MFKRYFINDWIKVGKKTWVKPFSVFWWLIRIGQCSIVVGFLYFFYLMVWCLCG